MLLHDTTSEEAQRWLIVSHAIWLAQQEGMQEHALQELEDVTKRYVIAVAAHNLGRILLALISGGKPQEAADLGLWPALKSACQGLNAFCCDSSRRGHPATASRQKSTATWSAA